MRELMNKTGAIGQDNLIARVVPAAATTGVVVRKLATAATIKRGTIMSRSSVDGKLVVLGTSASEGETLTPAFVLCDDIEVGTSEDAPTVAYSTGCFNRAAVIMAPEYTMTAGDEDALRKYGIVFCVVMDA